MGDQTFTTESPVLHVVVIGFHHKKGCQVEFSYPPLIEGNPVDSNQVPEEWKHLPSLGIPDGAHNYTKDTIFFHLPSRQEKHKTVYGVACYRQIDTKDLVNKSSDVTRSSVQKSVCVLSKLPLFGLIQTKLELITHAYFDEKDFSKVQLLEETYKNLTASLSDSLKEGSHMCLGMSVRDVVVEFKHKIVVLFKLILLERRVLFSGTPVERLCNSLLSVLSLFPGMIEYGLEEAATCGGERLLSPTLHPAMYGSTESDEYLEVHYHDEKPVLKTSSDSSLNKQTSDKAELNRSLSVEPQPLTIDRECEVDKDSEGSTVGSDYVRVEAEDKESCDTEAEKSATQSSDLNNCDNIDNADIAKPDISGSSPIRFCNGILIGEHNFVETKLTANTQTPQKSTKGDKEKQPKTPTSADSIQSDPFMNMKSITQIEAVQTGEIIKNNSSVVNIEEYAEKCEEYDENEKSSNLELSLNLEDLKRSNSIEDIDSPESIQKIDREDCFSWEEDSLLLTIDPNLDSSGDHSEQLKAANSLAEKKSEADERLSQPIENPFTKTSQLLDGDVEKKEDVSFTDIPLTENNSKAEEKDSPGKKAAALKNKLSTAFGGFNVKEKIRNRKANNNKMIPMQDLKVKVPNIPKLQQDDCGFPLIIFTKGYICHPYLSLQYYDLLNDVNIRGFVIGATNILFRQKRHLTDAVVEVSEEKIEFHDKELQKLLNLTTADLRFADILVKAVVGDSEDSLFETTGWEGGDEWLRAQFKVYLQSLLVTCKQDDVKLHEDFGLPFLQSFKTTQCYRVWSGDTHPGMSGIPLGHPCHGNLGVSDIKVRLAHSMQSTERGKKINAAVTQTGKFVGGAITTAKSAVSSWFSNLTTDWKKEEKSEPES
ncbi:late secretory pathway protein AVL9 homolog isoform X1 [Mytilus edulis]|uniref:late secretory pathway protein AVL9 homolog isoform X1 n=2 Tax=Mytilus edulis TaxID=6550 RepID=UPI0039EF0305